MGLNGRFIVKSTGVLAMVLYFCASIAAADEIRIGTIPYPNIRITNINDDSLEYFITGQKRTVELSRVSVADLNKYPNFGQAVKQLEADPASAANQFRGVLADLKEEYLRPMVQSYLVTALDQAGQFDQAVGEYLKLVDKYPQSYFAMRPPSKVSGDVRQLRAAAQLITAALPSIRNDAQRGMMEKLLARLTASQPAPAAPPAPAATAPAQATTDQPAEAAPAAPAAPVAPQPAEVEPAAPQASFISMTSIEMLMKAGKYQEAVDQANKMMDRPRAPLPDLFYQRALAETALGQHDRAAMSYLRVAIHFADHKLAVPALYQAGQSLTQAGDPADAANVYRAALTRAQDAATRQQIQRALDALPATNK